MKRILVVDDDPDQAELLAQVLGARGRRIMAFSDPVRALAVLHHEGADLLIADLSMPWLDGRDVLISARDSWPDIRIVLVSGYTRGAEIAAAQGLPFFAKPLDYDALQREVSTALGDSAAPP